MMRRNKWRLRMMNEQLQQHSKPPLPTVLRCSKISSWINSSHKCSRKKCLARGSRNPLFTYNSTKNTDNHEFLLQLYQTLIGTDLLDRSYISRSMINALEKKMKPYLNVARILLLWWIAQRRGKLWKKPTMSDVKLLQQREDLMWLEYHQRILNHHNNNK